MSHLLGRCEDPASCHTYRAQSWTLPCHQFVFCSGTAILAPNLLRYLGEARDTPNKRSYNLTFDPDARNLVRIPPP